MSFRDELDEPGRREWDEWVAFQRRTNIKGMASSAIVMSIFPRNGVEDFDVEYALQIGACLMLEKPLLFIVKPGIQIPEKLVAVADEIIEVSDDDLDTGSPEVAAKIAAFVEKHVKAPK